MIPNSKSPTSRHTRRSFLQLIIASTAGVLSTGTHLQHTAYGATTDEARSSDPALEEVLELNRRIETGRAVRLRDGTVVVDGWYLPANYVRMIQQVSQAL